MLSVCPSFRAGGLALVLGALVSVPPATGATQGPVSQVSRIAESASAELRSLLLEVLERNPELAAIRARADAAVLRGREARGLPDPTLSTTAYVSPPETRVGPQRFMTSLQQRLPWFGKRGLREQAALREADGLEARLEARRLELITATRRLYAEIAFLDASRRSLELDRATLVHYEELARARYESGVGLGQGVIRIQAGISSDDARLLEIASRRASLVASLNALRDRPGDAEVGEPTLPSVEAPELPEAGVLLERARRAQPELRRAALEIDRADTLVGLARKEGSPDVTLGVSYTAVEERTDPAGILAPPTGNGRDVFAVTVSLNLPVWRGRIAAGLEAAAAQRLGAVEQRRAAEAEIGRALSELRERVRLSGERLRLFEGVLSVQAEQSLESAEAAYAAGSVNALDLLDAERTLLEVSTGKHRARADLAIALAELEGALGERVTGDAEGGGR
jgi:cobalt-zinc-cadmium efflux system outer membrane protein